MGNRFALSFSGGKDSVLSLYRLVTQGWEPACLLTSFNREQGRSWFHGIPERMLRELSECMEIPLQLIDCGAGEDYNKAFEQALHIWKAQGVSACAFGDIDISDHRVWCEERCSAVGIEALLPLWRMEREAAVREFISSGFRAVVKNVRLAELDESFLGRELTFPLLEEIRRTGADVCGENGEYHTAVVDGPLFRRPTDLRIGEIFSTQTHAFLELL